jgi:hypothetical protein
MNEQRISRMLRRGEEKRECGKSAGKRGNHKESFFPFHLSKLLDDLSCTLLQTQKAITLIFETIVCTLVLGGFFVYLFFRTPYFLWTRENF